MSNLSFLPSKSFCLQLAAFYTSQQGNLEIILAPPYRVLTKTLQSHESPVTGVLSSAYAQHR